MISDISKRNLIILTIVLCLILSFRIIQAQTVGSTQSQSTQQIPQPQTVSTAYYANVNQKTRTFVDRISELPNTFTFGKNLKRNQLENPDVNYLKWVLNSDPRTELTDNPNKTLLELNASFGPITQDAVKRFQIVYKDDILIPLGLNSPTGIVGPSTRTKLNWLLTQARNIATTKNTLKNGTYENTYNTNSSTNYGNDFVYFSSNNYFSDLNTSQNQNVSSSNQISTSSTDYSGTTSASTVSESLNTNTGNTGTGTSLSSSNNSNNSSDATGLGVLAIVGAVALLGDSSQTAANIAVSNFGGKITSSIYCTCSQNYIITIFDLSIKAPLSVMYQPGVSSIKMNYNPTVGQTVLGGYIKSPNTCLMYTGSSCSPIGIPVGTIDTIRGIGTTLSPVGE